MGIFDRFKDRRRSRAANFELNRPIALEMLEPRLMLSAEPIPTAVASALSAGIGQFESELESFIDNETLLDTYLPLIVRNEGDNLINMKSVAPTMRELLYVNVDINGDTLFGTNPDVPLASTLIDAENELHGIDTDADPLHPEDDRIDIIEFLQAQFFAQITSYLGGSPTDEGLVAELEGLGDTWGLETGLESPADFYNPARYVRLQVSSVNPTGDDSQVSFEFNFTLTFGNELAIDLGTAAEEMGIILPSANLVVETSLSFYLEFGVFTSGEDPTNNDFFIEVQNLKVRAYDTLSMAGAPLNVGFLGGQMTGGTITLEAEVSADLTDPTSATALGFTAGQFGQTVVQELTASNTLSDFSLGHDVYFFLRIGNSDTKKVKVDSAGTGSASALQTNIQTALNGAGFTNLVTASVSTGNPVKLSLPTNQQSEVGKMGFATVNPVTNPLLDEGGVLIAANAPSILGSSSSTTISFLLSVGHAVPKLVAVTTTAGGLTLEQLRGNIQTGLDTYVNGGLTTGHVEAKIDDKGTADTADDRIKLEFVPDPGESAQALEIPLTLTLDSKISYDDLLDSPTSLLLPGTVTASEASASLDVSVTPAVGSFEPSFDITLGVDPFGLAPPVPDPQTGDERFAFSITLENISGGTEEQILNFTNITASNVVGLLRQFGSWLDGLRTSELIASFGIPFADADLGELLDFADMLERSLLFDEGLFEGISTLKVTFADANPDTITRNLGNWSDDGFAAGDIIAVEGSSSNDGIYTIDNVSGSVMTLIASDILTDEPLVPDVTVSLVKLITGDSISTFSTAQGLAGRLADILGVSLSAIGLNYDTDPDSNPGTNDAELTYDIDISHVLGSLEVPIDFSLDLSPLLNLSSDTTILLEASAGLVMTFCFNLGSVSGEMLTGGTTLTELGVEVKTDPAVTGVEEVRIIYGRLTGDATFRIDLGGGQVEAVVHAMYAELTGSPTLTFADNGGDPATVTRSNGSWIDDGFNPGDRITISNTTSVPSNDGVYKVADVLDDVITLDVAHTVTDFSETGVTVTRNGTDDNTSVADLVSDINQALSDAGLAGKIEAVVDSGFEHRINLRGIGPTTQFSFRAGSLEFANGDPDAVLGADPASQQLGFPATADITSADGLVLKGTKDVPVIVGQLTSDGSFTLAVDGEVPVSVTIPVLETETNKTIIDLVNDVNSALAPFVQSGTILDVAPTSDVTFTVRLNDDPVGTDVTVYAVDPDGEGPLTGMSDNTTVDDLVRDINRSIGQTDLSGRIRAESDGSSNITLKAVNTWVKKFNLTAATGNALGLPENQTVSRIVASSLGNRLVLTADTAQATFDGVGDVDVGANTINVGSHSFVTGGPIIYTNAGGTSIDTISGELTDGGTYYVIVENATTIKLAETEVNALADTEIDFTSVGSGVGHQIRAPPVTGFTVTAAPGNELGLPDNPTDGRSNGDDLIIHLSDETEYRVQLDGAITISDVINAIHFQTDPDGIGPAGPDVVVGFDDITTPTALTLTDETFSTGNPQIFFVAPINGSNAAIQLGIVRADVTSDVNDDGDIDNEDADGIIIGAPIIGPKLTDRFFVENVDLSATFDLTTPEEAPGDGDGDTNDGINALATFGFVGVSLHGGGSLGGKVSTELIGSGPTNRLTLTELLEGLNDIRSIVEEPAITAKSGNVSDPLGQIELVLSLEPDIVDLGTLISNPNITISVNDIGDPFAETVFSSPVFGDSTSFSLAGDQIAVLQKGADVSAQLSSGIVTTKIAELEYDGGITTITVLDEVLDGTLSQVTIATPVPPDIEITTTGLTDLSGLGNLLDFDQLDFVTILDGIQALFDFLRQFEAFDFLDEPLPLINKSMNDLLSFAEGFDRSVFDAVFESASEFKVSGNITDLLKSGAEVTLELTSGTVESKITDFTFGSGFTTVTLLEPVLDSSLSKATILTKLLFAAAVQEAEDAAAGQIQVLESKLKDMLGLPVLGTAELGFTYNQYSPAGTGELVADTALTDSQVASLVEPIVFLLSVGGGVPKKVTVETESASDVAGLVNNIRAGLTAAFDPYGLGIPIPVDVTANGGQIKFYSTALPAESLEIRDYVDLSLVTSSSSILRIDLTLLTSFSESLGVEIPDFLDLSAAGFGTAGLAGSAGLNASGALAANLDFGIGLTGAEFGEFYLFDTTGIKAGLSASGSDLTFRAALGPLGLYVKGGSATIGGDFSLELDDAAPIFTNHRASIGDIFSSVDNIDVNVGGAINVTLPTYFPNESKYIGDITVTGDLEDIGNIVFITDPSELPAPADSLVFDLSDVVPDILDFDFSKLSLFDNLLLAVDGVDLFLEGLQNLLDGEVFGFKIPLIGDALSGGARFIEDFRKDFVQPFREAIEAIQDAAKDFSDADKNIVSKFLFDILGPSPGIGLLQPRPDANLLDGETPGDYVGLDTNLDEYLAGDGVSLSELYIEWDVSLGQEYTVGTDIGLDLGIPGLGIKTEGDVSVTLNWDLDLGFGISFADGFYIDISDANELTAFVDIDLNDTSLTGTLGFLQLSAAVQAGTNLGLAFEVDIKNRKDASDEKLSFTELTRIGIGAGIAAEAAAYLGLTLEISDDLIGSNVASGLPRVTADFVFEWGIGTYVEDNPLTEENETETSSFVPLTEIGNAIKEGLSKVAFEDISLDLGSFVSDVLGPIVSKVKEFTEPIQPVIDIMTTPAPVLSDLGLRITLLDIAAAYGRIDPRLIQAIADIITFINNIPDPDAVGAVILDFGDMIIYSSTPVDPEDPLSTFTPELWDSESDPQEIFDAIMQNKDKLLTSIFGDNWFTDTLGDLTEEAAEIMKDALDESGGKSPWSFPILEDPSQVFGLLMGRPAVLVAYDMPPLDFEFEWSQFFSIWGPLGVSINMEFFAEIDFAFGYDTLGIQQFVEGGFRNPLLLLNGFYISDTDLPTGDFGTDVPELVFGGGLWAAAEINLVVARAGVGGGIFAKVEFNLFDPDHDGRVRIMELVGNVVNEWNYGIKALAPLAIFDVYGEVTARLFAFLKIDLFLFEINYRFDITPPLTLVEFDIPFTRPPNLATEVGNGDLQINGGDFADERLNGNKSDIGEYFIIEQDGAGKVKVMAPGIWSHWQSYAVGSGGTIYVNLGEGDDHLDASGVTDPNIKFEIDGGPGNDIIVLGPASAPGASVIYGTDGDDVLVGGSGNDVIYGGKGNDIIHGGDGDDLIFGDEGIISDATVRVVVNSTDGDDTIYGDGGDDILFGAGGIDTIEGGGNNDIIIGDGGLINFWTMTGTATSGGPNTLVDADLVPDEYFPTSGSGLAGFVVEITGGTGGGQAREILSNTTTQLTVKTAWTTQPGADSTYQIIAPKTEANIDWAPDKGVEDTELMQLGSGDILKGDSGDDKIYGGVGDDEIYGGGGSDELFGETGFDSIWGGSGDDTVFGDGWRVVTVGSIQVLRPTSGGQVDTIYGDAGADTIYGSDGGDYIEGGDDGDEIYGGSGADTIYGDAVDRGVNDGVDTIYGQGDPDEIYGGGDGDTLDGGDGDDLVFGDNGPEDYKDRVYSVQEALEDVGLKDWIKAELDGSSIKLIAVDASIIAFEVGASPSDPDGYLEFGFTDGQSASGLPLSLTGSAVSGPLLAEAVFRISITTADGTVARDAKAVPISDSGGDDTIHAGFGLDRLDGQGGSDTYILRLRGGDNESLIEVFDSGEAAGGVDLMKVYGTSEPDQFLLRASADPTGLAFVALINSATRRDSGGELVVDLTVERINYDNLERLVVNGGLGDDRFAVDDTRAEATLNGGLGEDFFQIGQLYRSQRTSELANVDPGDVFATIETTRGWLSNGISLPMVVNGGAQNDDFVVFHNIAVLGLNGGDGDDKFMIKAFALAGSEEPKRGRTDVSGGHGADLVQYAVNAPVNIDGGDGFDTVIIIGTEFGDDFVITKDGIYGAGLNVNFVNIEALEVDGAEGDDRFFVRSTGEGFITQISGGLGNDTFYMSGETPPVISNDLLGHSGIITHSIEVEGENNEYEGVKVDGISANVADNDEPGVRITPSEGQTTVTEGHGEDSYTIVLTSQPTADVFIRAMAPIQTPTEEELESKAFRVYSVHLEARNEADGSATTLRFTPENWNIPQMVYVDAQGDYDDLAYEGIRHGVINHTVTSQDTSYNGTLSSVEQFILDDNSTRTVITDILANFPTAGGGLRGAYIEIIEGPGAGQKFLIEKTGTLSDPTQSQSLTFFGTFSVNNLPAPATEDPSDVTYYIIRRYDGMALPSVNVQIHDNDSAGVAVAEIDDEGNPDGSTEVIEVETPTDLQADYLQIAVTRRPVDGTPVEVTVSSIVPEQVKFDGSPDGVLNLDGSLTLTFTYDDWDAQTVKVTAIDDDVREGFHYGLITFEVSGELDGAGSVTGETFELTDKPEEYVGPPVDFLGLPEAFVGLSYTPKPETVSVTVDGVNVNDMPDLDFTVLSNKVVFLEAGQTIPKTISGTVVVGYDYAVPGYEGLFVDPVLVRIADNNAPGVVITEKYGSTDVIEASGSDKVLMTGNVSSASDYTLVDDTGPFATDGSLVGKVVRISSGSGEGQWAIIDSNTETELTVSPGWSGSLSGSMYEISDDGDLLHMGKVTSSGPFTLTDTTGVFAPENSLAGYFVEVVSGPGEGQVKRIESNTETTLTLEENWDTGEEPDNTSTYRIVGDGVPWSDTYSVVLTSRPSDVVWVVITPEITKATRGKIRNDLVQVQVTTTDTDAPGHVIVPGTDPESDPDILKLKFTTDNWDQPQYVTVTAVDDSVVDGGDTKVFAPKLHVVSDIQGPVFVNGFGGSGSLLAFEPVMLPGDPPDVPAETNIKPDTKSLVHAETTTIEVVTADALSSGDVGVIEELIGKTIEITEGPAIDKFRLIKNAVQSTANPDNTILTINAPFTILEDGAEVEVEIPDGTQYLITEESWTFFVNEEEQVDFLFLFHEDSVADNIGGIADSTAVGFEGNGLVEQYTVRLNGKRIYGLGMGQDLYIGGVLQPGGISYGNLEVVEINLGSGNDEFIVEDTHSREDGFQTWTMVNTGDNTGGADVVYVSLTWEAEELITGTATSSTETTLTDDSGPFGAGDSLVGYIVEIIAGTGAGAQREIISNTINTIEVSSPWPTEDNLLGSDSEYKVIIAEADGSFALNTEAGDDCVYAAGGTFILGNGENISLVASTIPLVIFGGEGSDEIHSGTADDIIFGDRGQVDYFDENGMIVTRLGVDRKVITGEVSSASNTVTDPFDPDYPEASLSGSDIYINGTPASFPVEGEGISGLAGLEVQITHYTGFGQELLTQSNTSDELTLSGNWDPLPLPENPGDPLSKFRIPLLPEDQTDGVVRAPLLVMTTHADVGGDDTITGNAGVDTIFGGSGDDAIDGGTGDDVILGDNGRLDYTPVASVTESGPAIGDVVDARLEWILTTHLGVGGADVIHGGPNEDVLIGGNSGDAVDGGSDDDLVFGDNVRLDRSGDRYDDYTSPRFRALLGTVIYNLDAVDQVDDFQDYEDPTGVPTWANWDIFINDPAVFNDYGNDYIAGGGHDDTIFGQMGDDTIQGDGAVTVTAVAPSPGGPSFVIPGFFVGGTPVVFDLFEVSTDGDDYVEGNGGDGNPENGEDLIYGGLGQDDIIGGSSDLFSLKDTQNPEHDRELRQDGADTIFGGAGNRADRNHMLTETNRDTIVLDESHARDADMILGDNGDIFRLLDPVTGQFLSFNYDDASYDGYDEILKIIPRAARLLDYTPGGLDYDAANAASDIGDDDELHGESGDDYIYGMVGSDILYGDSEDDDLIGGYGHDWISGGSGDDGVLGDDGRIYTSRNDANAEPLYGVAGIAVSELNKYIYTPGEIQQATINVAGQLKKTVNLTPFNPDPDSDPVFDPVDTKADDIIYGGLGNDWLHGGSGDDAISGAEALEEFYDNPDNPGDVLGYDPQTGTFAYYDYDQVDPLNKIEGFLLNFEAEANDGNDVLFGDLGNDWLMGGTDSDHLYGGYGSDVLNVDDNLETDGGTNREPDQDTNADIAYGGAGRDVLIANTEADRLIDWVGEFNSYIVPFAPFGKYAVSRKMQPRLMEYLYDLSESDGADPTRALDANADPARNGEPFGELGLVTQKDPDWHIQAGPPRGPQAGNLPGKKG